MGTDANNCNCPALEIYGVSFLESRFLAHRLGQSFFPLLSFCEGLWKHFCLCAKKYNRFNKVYLIRGSRRNSLALAHYYAFFILFFAVSAFLAPGAAQGYGRAWEQTLIIVTALRLKYMVFLFWKAGSLPVGWGSPSFRFYLFVRVCGDIFVCAPKSITASIRFI
ncbi:hypothetical protein [Pedobacter zeae]|uniref:Uncharacterized protein n=1 Tax=Pedobacter zeae TaxID=1737356 RepID=A0A7W6KEW7_9SPHI|nr:hypothetical protein [Pedobacter zeae]MBB4110367.1 hypothetical protein [Pedobacter zeae]